MHANHWYHLTNSVWSDSRLWSWFMCVVRCSTKCGFHIPFYLNAFILFLRSCHWNVSLPRKVLPTPLVAGSNTIEKKWISIHLYNSFVSSNHTWLLIQNQTFYAMAFNKMFVMWVYRNGFESLSLYHFVWWTVCWIDIPISDITTSISSLLYPIQNNNYPHLMPW